MSWLNSKENYRRVNVKRWYFGIIPLVFLTVINVCPRLLAEEIKLTPLILKVLETPWPIRGSDGNYHLLYELRLTNVTSRAWRVNRLDILDERNLQSDLAVFEGKQLKKRMALIGTRKLGNLLGPDETAVVWLHLKISSWEKVPHKFLHRLQGTSLGQSVNELGGMSAVDKRSPIVIESPLKGDRWLVGNGCCEVEHHIRALLPLEGQLYSAERFAIDWDKLGEGNRIYRGDRRKVESYFGYGMEVLAVAEATVVNAMDRFPNQIPGKSLNKIELEESYGNHVVLDLGGGSFALYAHLKPGSIRVRPGEKVRDGQVLGQVGNSGNSSEPHLHFQVMDSPSPWASNGLPFVLKSFEILGTAATPKSFHRAIHKGTPVEIIPVSNPGLRFNEFPLDLSLVKFH